MGVGIDGPPNVYNAGLDFDYSVWTAGTRVDLVNVPWNNDYRDVVMYDTAEEFDGYINGLQSSAITIENMTYAKPNEDIYLPIPYNRVNRYNYLRASNPLMPIPGDIQKNYYYFILQCEYVNPSTTKIRLQLDVWSTFVYNITFGNCYVERGHIGIANNKAFRNYGRDYLTVPEGIDVGSDFQILYAFNEFLIANNQGTTAEKGCVVVVSTVDLDADPGTPSNPKLVSAKGGRFAGMPSGASMYVFEHETSFRSWLISVQNFPWVTQGIISATLVPHPSRYGIPQSFTANHPVELHQQAPLAHIINFQNDWRESVKEWIPERYRHLLKFLTSEYMIIELTMFMANPIAIKPELWANDNLEFEELAAIAPPNQKVTVYPKGYNAYTADPAYQDEETSFATHLVNLPTLAVVNNMAISYLASNKNSIFHQRESAGWAQQRALGMAAGQYDVSTGAIRTAQELAGIGISADIAQTANQNRTIAAQAIFSGIGNAIGGGAAGSAFGPAGAGVGLLAGGINGAANGINTGIQTAANDESLAIRNAQAGQTVGVQNRQAQLSRDTNIDLARFAARGDYANTIAGINAKVQDANMIQPSVSGQMGGDSLNYVNNLMKIRATIKRIDNAATTIIGEFWLRYGYAIRAFIKPPQSLRVMSKFSYWKMTETYIVAATVPEGHKQAIRGILEKGVTVWVNPDDIGVIDIADNEPLEGISY